MSTLHLTLTQQHLKLPLILGSIFLWHEFGVQFSDSFQSARLIFSRRCPVLIPKNPKILSHKSCLDHSSKHSRWFAWILQTLTRYEKVTKNIYKIDTQLMHLSHILFFIKECFYTWHNLDFQSTKKVISGKIFQIKYLNLLKNYI